jgi:hypothetical protein
MKKILFVIANYPDQRQQFFEQHFSVRNQKFAEIHNYEYIVSKGGDLFRGNPTWWKFTLLKEMIDSGKLQDGDKVLHLDADMRIDKFNQDYPCEKSFSYSIDTGNTHCMGNYAIKINDWSRNMIDLILSEERFVNLNDKLSRHDRFGYINAFWHEFREQASWYSLAGIKRHSDVPFKQLKNNGFHSTSYPEDTVYSIEELEEHVQVLPAHWNVTQVPGESNLDFYINKTKPENIIIRHFAGGQKWRDGNAII